MAYGTISTLSSGGTLSHTHLNLLQSNAEFLRDIALRSNWPCPSLHRDSISGFTVDNHHFYFRHWNRYLKFEVENGSGSMEQVYAFYDGHKVYGDETPANPTTETVDLHDPSTWPHYAGAWVTATAYDGSADGNGNGEIVSRSGSYYKCTSDHTSGAGTEPGVGGSWATVWDLIDIATLGAWYKCYFYVTAVTGSIELAINYVYEDSVA